MRSVASRVLLAVALVGGLALAGCGGESAYCATIRRTETQLRAIGSAATDDDLTAASGAAGRIADEAPPEIEPDWRRIATALDTFRTALRASGTTYQDLLAKRNLQDLTQADRTRLNAALSALRQANSTEVTDRINAHVEEECDIVIRPS